MLGRVRPVSRLRPDQGHTHPSRPDPRRCPGRAATAAEGHGRTREELWRAGGPLRHRARPTLKAPAGRGRPAGAVRGDLRRAVASRRKAPWARTRHLRPGVHRDRGRVRHRRDRGRRRGVLNGPLHHCRPGEDRERPDRRADRLRAGRSSPWAVGEAQGHCPLRAGLTAGTVPLSGVCLELGDLWGAVRTGDLEGDLAQ